MADAHGPVLLVAHSLGCILTAWWAAHARHAGQGARRLAGGPGDVERPDLAAQIHGWAPIARQPLPFPALLVGSRNDPYCSLERAEALAQAWGARFVDYGERGHINAGIWPGRLGPKAMAGCSNWLPLERRPHTFQEFVDMVTKKPKGLGRGLEALLGPKVEEKVEQAQAVQAGLPSALPLTELVPGVYQPRTRMDEGALYELAESIKAQGIMQPILVRRLVAERRRHTKSSRASAASAPRDLAGLAEVPVLVRDVPDEAAAAMALIENIQREDLNPLEEAQGLQRLIREFGLTHQQAAQAVGRSRSAASNLLRLLNLAEPVQTMLMAGDIDMGHARALLALDKAEQITAGNQIAAASCRCVKPKAWSRRSAPNSTWCRKSPRRKVARHEAGGRELSDLLMAAGGGAREKARQAGRAHGGHG